MQEKCSFLSKLVVRGDGKMKHVKSKRPDHIFYGDVFSINGKGCLVFGAGKTQACKSAIQEVGGSEIASDFACITRENDKSYGHFEIERSPNNNSDPIHKRIKLDYFIRMLNAEETHLLFKATTPAIMEIDYEEFVQLSLFNIQFVAPEIFSELPTLTEKKPNKRVENFINYTKDTAVTPIIVPWKEDFSDKVDLIKKYFGQY